MNRILAHWASTVLGAVLVYVALLHNYPHITNWLLAPAILAGGVAAGEFMVWLYPRQPPKENHDTNL